jgi:hypothetical protein
MKKILVIMIITMAIAIASPVFAISVISAPTGTTIGGATFVPSASVNVKIISDALNYACTSAHLSSASGPGYQFQIWSGFNGITKKQWDSANGTVVGTWPDPVTSSTGTVAGFL